MQRVFIHESIFEKFKARLLETGKLEFGDPYTDDTSVGPMITTEEAERAEKWITEAKNAGAEILTGGGRSGAVLEPTVIENAPDDVNVKCAEDACAGYYN